MEFHEINNITTRLMNEGYELNSINQISKCLTNGLKYIENISMTIPASTIRQINEAYMKFYKDKLDESDIEDSFKLIIDYANEGADISPLLKKMHKKDFLATMIPDLREGYSTELYQSPDDKKDFNLDKVHFIKSLVDRHVFDDLNEEQTKQMRIFFQRLLVGNYEIARNLTSTNEIREHFINAKENGILMDFINSLEDVLGKDDIQKKYLDTYLSKKHPEIFEEIKSQDSSFKTALIDLLKDEKCEFNAKLIKKNLHKLSGSELKPILNLTLTDTQLEILDLNFKRFDMLAITKFPEDHNIKLVKLFGSYEKIPFSRIHDTLKDFAKLITPDIEEDALKFFKMELDNNPGASTSDFREIIYGLQSGIDVMRYVTEDEEKQSMPYTEDEKKFIRLLLEYNKKHESAPIDLNDVFIDDDDKGNDFYDTSNIDGLIRLLEVDINITPYVEADNDMIYALAEEQESYKLSEEQLQLMAKYYSLAEEERDLSFLMSLVSQQYQVMDKHDIYKASVNVYKEINQVAQYDDFTRKMIDERLTDDNCEKLLWALQQYIDATGLFKEICKYNIQHDLPFFIDKNTIEAVSEDKLEVIYKDLIDGINPAPYSSNAFSLEQIQKLSEINRLNEHTNSYRDKKIEEALRKICYPEVSIELLDYVKRQIELDKVRTENLKKEYSCEQTKLYDSWDDVIYIYNYILYSTLKEADEIVAKSMREARKNLDKNSPLEEQKKAFIQAQLDGLAKAADEIDNMEAKIIIFKLQESLEQKQSKQIENHIEK